MSVTLSHGDGGGGQGITRETDADGRIDFGTVPAARYRLSFDVGAYYKKKALTPFLDRVTIEFHVSDSPKYHVPLLMSPFACSSYRGS